MKRILSTTALATIAAFSAFAAPANATVYIALQEDGGAITPVGSSSAASASFNGNFGLFSVNLVTGLAALTPALLNTTAQTQATGLSGVHTLDIYVTRDFITGPVTGTLTTGNLNALTAGWQVELRTFLSTTNAMFGGDVLLSDQTLNTTLSEFAIGGPGSTANPYSVTARYTVTTSGASGEQNSTLNIKGVPEASTWSMMLAGFGAIGFVMRRTRKSQPKVRFAF